MDEVLSLSDTDLKVLRAIQQDATGSARQMEERKRAQAEYDACVARKAEEMRKADSADPQ